MRKISLTFFIFFIALTFAFSQSYKIKKLEKKLSISSGTNKILLLDNLAETYLDFDYKKSINYADEALKSIKKQDISENTKASLYNTLGAAYYYSKNYRKSLKYYEKELEIIKKTNSGNDIIKSYYNIGLIYQNSAKYSKASKNFKISLKLAKFDNIKNLILKNNRALYELHLEWGKTSKSLGYLQDYISIRDDEFKQSNHKVSVLRRKYYNEKALRKEKEIALQGKDSTLYLSEFKRDILIEDSIKRSREIELLNIEKALTQKIKDQEENLNIAKTELNNFIINKKKIQIFMISAILFVIFIASVWLYFMYRGKRIANEKLAEQNEEIRTQAEIIDEKNIEIVDSINYARRIQDSILIPESEIRRYLPDTFIYYQPKDIVSGDFYWFSKVKDELVLAAIDCTGHGVPGAFMSLIGNTLLNEIVNEKMITKPDIILKHLHLGIIATLKQTGNGSSSDDGMDMSLCTINPRLNRFQYAGAKSHLYVLQGDKLKVLKANHHSVGGRPVRSDIVVDFSSYDFMYDENTIIYMMSDGYMDQFGGLEDTKFNAKRFKQMLIDNRNLSMLEQKSIIKNTFADWKGNREQVDDILVLGVKLK